MSVMICVEGDEVGDLNTLPRAQVMEKAGKLFLHSRNAERGSERGSVAEFLSFTDKALGSTSWAPTTTPVQALRPDFNSQNPSLKSWACYHVLVTPG